MLKPDHSESPLRVRKVLLVFTLLLIIGVGVFAPLLSGFFIWDDFFWIEAAQRSQFFSLSDPTGSHFFRPVISLLFFLEYTIFGRNPSGYYLFNIVLHIINSLLLFIFVRQLVSSFSVALLSGFLFVISYPHYRPIIWISGQTSLLVTLFILTSLIFLLSDLQKPVRSKSWLTTFFFLLALLSKEEAVTLPLAGLLVVWVWKKSGGAELRTQPGALLLRYTPALVFWLIYLVGQFFITQENYLVTAGTYRAGTHILNNILSGILALFLIPPDLSVLAKKIDQGSILFLPQVAPVITGILLISKIVAAIGFFWLFWKESAVVRFALIWIIILFLPVSFFSGGIGSRYLYLPSLGFSILLAVLLYGFDRNQTGLQNRFKPRPFVVLVIIVFSVLSAVLLGREQKIWLRQGDQARAMLKAIRDYYDSQPIPDLALVDPPFSNIEQARVAIRWWFFTERQSLPVEPTLRFLPPDYLQNLEREQMQREDTVKNRNNEVIFGMRQGQWTKL